MRFFTQIIAADILHPGAKGAAMLDFEGWFAWSKEDIEKLINDLRAGYSEITDEEINMWHQKAKQRHSDEMDRLNAEAAKARRQPKPGHVYLMHADTGLYKIGRSKNITQRLTNLSTRMPVRLQLVAHYEAEDMVEEERYWHNLFDDKRIVDGGEWFELNEDDVKLFPGADHED